MLQDIIIFRRGNPWRGPFEGVDNENLAFQRGLRLFWPIQWPWAPARAILGPKKLRPPHPKMPFPQRVWLLLGSLSPSKFGDEISSFADPGMFIPDPRSRIPISSITDPRSWIQIFFILHPWSQILIFSIPDPGSRIRIEEFKYFNQKKMVSQLSEICSGFPSRIRILTFYPSQILILYPRSRI